MDDRIDAGTLARRAQQAEKKRLLGQYIYQRKKLKLQQSKALLVTEPTEPTEPAAPTKKRITKRTPKRMS